MSQRITVHVQIDKLWYTHTCTCTHLDAKSTCTWHIP